MNVGVGGGSTLPTPRAAESIRWRRCLHIQEQVIDEAELPDIAGVDVFAWCKRHAPPVEFTIDRKPAAAPVTY